MGKEIQNKARDINVQLAKGFDPHRIHQWDGWTDDETEPGKEVTVIHVAEPKLDGIRVIAIVNPAKDGVAFYSRNGRQLFMFAHLQVEILKFVLRAGDLFDERFLHGTMLDGEMVSKTGVFEDISGAIHTKDYTAKDARYYVFHAMPLEDFERGKDTEPQFVRAQMISRIIKRMKPEFIMHHAGIVLEKAADVMKAYAFYRKKGFEGVMVKQMHKPWSAGRSHTWMKVKPEETYEVVVTGIKDGKGKYEGTLGALRYEYEGKACSTSGMSDAERDEWWKLHKEGKLVGRMVEVKCSGVTNDGSLRHPRFVRFRDDKEATKTGRVSGKKMHESNVPKEAA